MNKSILKREIPEVEEYLALREKVGLSKRGRKSSEIGLGNSIHSVTIRKKSTGELIGMGRIVGDGTSYQVVDGTVAPEFQETGFGKKIMMELILYIQKFIDPLAYVSLIASCPANKLYEPFGFLETSPKSIGMYFKRS